MNMTNRPIVKLRLLRAQNYDAVRAFRRIFARGCRRPVYTVRNHKHGSTVHCCFFD